MIRALLFCLFATPAFAAPVVVPAQPDPVEEAARLDTMAWSDLTPLGASVRAGEQVILTLGPVPAGNRVSVYIGFPEMWGGSPMAQDVEVREGKTAILATVDGPVFLRHTGAVGSVSAEIAGGTPAPVYRRNVTRPQDWATAMAAPSDYVHFVSTRAIITLPRSVHDAQPVADPAATLAMLGQVIALCDDLAGLDGRSLRDQPNRNRLHYVVDFRATAEQRAQFYMYATDGMIGMLPDNTGDLTDPAVLSQEWAIWHETGHMYQQNSWTWGAMTEVTVNLFSLYVQENMGLESRLEVKDEDGNSHLSTARALLQAGPPDYLTDDSDPFFKLVMLDQLRATYGWQVFRTLARAARQDPLPWDAPDQAKADALMVGLIDATGHDLRPFFARWNLRMTPEVSGYITALALPLPPAALMNQP